MDAYVIAARIVDIDFAQPKRVRGTLKPRPDTFRAPSAEQINFLSTLKKLAPKAAVLSASFVNVTSQDQSTSPSLPPIIPSLFKARYKKNYLY